MVTEAEGSIEELTTAISASIQRQEAETEIVVQQAEEGTKVWAYYGHRVEKDWSEYNFITIRDKNNKKVTDNSILPKKKYWVQATGNVNAREDAIEFKEGKGWVNKPKRGIIKKGQEFKVLDVKIPIKGFYWIAIQFQAKE